MNDERVAGLGRFDIERTGFGIAAEDATDALFVCATGVHGGGMNGITGLYVQHGTGKRRKLATLWE